MIKVREWFIEAPLCAKLLAFPANIRPGCDKDKHSSLFCRSIGNEQEQFYETDTWPCGSGLRSCQSSGNGAEKDKEGQNVSVSLIELSEMIFLETQIAHLYKMS